MIETASPVTDLDLAEIVGGMPTAMPSERLLAEIDGIEKNIIAKLPPVELPVTHRFTPGMYIREIFLPAGTLVTTKIHKTEHPFVISRGRCSVWSQETGVIEMKAPLTGVTKPGTKRIIFVHEDAIWTTFHVTEKTDLAEIEKDVIYPHENPLLSETEKERLIDATK